MDSSSAAEVTVGDGEFDPGVLPVVTSGDLETDLVIPLAVDDMPRQSVPQLVQLFELQASRQGHAAQRRDPIPHRLPIIQEEDADDEDEVMPPQLSGGTSADGDDCIPLAEEDLVLSALSRRAFDERIAGYYAALNASFCEDPG